MIENAPIVGIGLMIVKGTQVLLGRRKGAHGAGEYAFPGGKLEYMEGFADCALRELAEECGPDLKITTPRFLLAANVRQHSTRQHYICVTMVAEWVSGEPQLMEPEKAEGWAWHDLDALPGPLFHMSRISIESYRTGRVFYDLGDVRP